MSGITHTVGGPIGVDELGHTSVHEHILFDFRGDIVPAKNTRGSWPNEPISLETLHEATRQPDANYDNLVNMSTEVAANELGSFSEAGGRTIVDLTPGVTPKRVAKLRSLSEGARVNIIVSTGPWAAHVGIETNLGKRSEIIAEAVTRQAEVGIDGVLPFVIGEIRVPDPVDASTESVLVGVARAQRATGLPVFLTPSKHCGIVPPSAVSVLDAAGVSLDRVVVGVGGTNESQHLNRLLETGVLIAFDQIGAELRYTNPYRSSPRDVETIVQISELIEGGWVHQILLSQGVHFKIQLETYGGWGWSHILRNIAWRLEAAGVESHDVETMTCGNSSRLFSGSV